MSVTTILERAKSLGIVLQPEGVRGLYVRGPKAAMRELAPILKQHKPEILAQLQAAMSRDPDARRAIEAATHEAARELFEERAGIAEHDGGQSREAAEALALKQTEAWRRECWERFRQTADRIRGLQNQAARDQALDQYYRDKVVRYGAITADVMLREMVGWIRFRSDLATPCRQARTPWIN